MVPCEHKCYLKLFRDPFRVLLWYLLLNKKNIIMALFKMEQNQKQAEFFTRDFTDQR